MNRMGRDTVSVVMDKLPILNKVICLIMMIAFFLNILNQLVLKT